MKKEDINERKLVEKVLAGERRAARDLYQLLAPKLSQLFAKKVERSKDADELVQDTFLHVLDALPLFRFQSSLTTFAISIARHEIADYWRKKYAKRMIKTVPVVKEIPTTPYTSERTARAMHHAVENAYAAIKPVQAQLLRWKYEDGRSVKEMAEELGWTDKAVEAQLYRARKAFQLAYVEPEEYE